MRNNAHSQGTFTVTGKSATENFIDDGGLGFEIKLFVNRLYSFLEWCKVNFADLNPACGNIFKRLFAKLDG